MQLQLRGLCGATLGSGIASLRQGPNGKQRCTSQLQLAGKSSARLGRGIAARGGGLAGSSRGSRAMEAVLRRSFSCRCLPAGHREPLLSNGGVPQRLDRPMERIRHHQGFSCHRRCLARSFWCCCLPAGHKAGTQKRSVQGQGRHSDFVRCPWQAALAVLAPWTRSCVLVLVPLPTCRTHALVILLNGETSSMVRP